MIRSDSCFSCDIFPTSVVGSVPAAAATALPCPAVQSISYALSTRQHQHHHQQHAHAQYYRNCHVSDYSLLGPNLASDLYKMTNRLMSEIQKIGKFLSVLDSLQDYVTQPIEMKSDILS